MTEQRKAVIKNADMSEDMQQDAVDIASQALAKYNIEKDHFPSRKNRKKEERTRKATTMTEQRKAVIKNADMSEDMQQDAVDIASQALAKYNIEKDVAAYIKKEFDKKHNPTWHVIVGRNFGSYVTHETKHFIYFYLGQVAVLLFKSG
eukprot:CAMPEP_0172574040 /NCGR_PEP_ID=MMETSP1067-20121228/136501_1 /TAXON_ID=265564 ORGANISM="Thalassiosira punctigera, Strain Tpunct2005C2" /NCGR_SAMPLE_ID=MMETSP1067 /ASSEMBLY_ACC=CAM_ASM_000444 /LENGTH=147 /DNA_ID=CAMNT_0013366663 /DNA_START=293 /DNA_END=737 /DNA_ORIENTATION=-